MLAGVLPAIRAHHERLNGTGYPAGLAGDEIPLGARILAVADAYEAMTHDRPHRPAVSPLIAMRELRRCCPSGFDPQCVEALAHVLNVPALEETLVARRRRG
jgi:HD-GYP domain-containing protein (c-di-GMP phosphodiesterase class II)